MRTKAVFVMTVAVIFAITACSKKKGKEAAGFPDEIVDGQILATVNDHPITGRDLKVFSVFYSPPRSDTIPAAAANERLLDRLIDRILIWQEAVAGGSVVSQDELEQTVATFARSVGGQEALAKFMDRAGLKKEELMSTIRKDLIIRQFIRKVLVPQVKVGEGDARSYYDAHRDQFVSSDSVRARHILLRVFPGDNDSVKAEKKKKAKSILARIKQGEDFALLAREYSDDPSKEKGGDMGYFARHTMVAPFDSAAFALAVGQVSEVVKSPFGYHIIKVEDKKAGRPMEFEEVKENLVAGIRDFKLAGLIEKHLQEIRKMAIIKRQY